MFFILLLTVILLLSDTHSRALYFAVPFQYPARARHCFIVRTIRYPSSSVVKLAPGTIINESLWDGGIRCWRFPGGKNMLSQRRPLVRTNSKISNRFFRNIIRKSHTRRVERIFSFLSRSPKGFGTGKRTASENRASGMCARFATRALCTRYALSPLCESVSFK